ncbi:hypothetical protein pb186bvf_000440 [Paramecium bursaria]
MDQLYVILLIALLITVSLLILFLKCKKKQGQQLQEVSLSEIKPKGMKKKNLKIEIQS